MNLERPHAIPRLIATERLQLIEADQATRDQLDRLARDPAIAPTYALYRTSHDSGDFHGIWLCDRDDLIGTVGLTDGEIAFFILPRLWGKGYATEAVGAFCAALARSGQASVDACIVRENFGSLKVLESVGFRFFGLVPRHGRGPAPSVGPEQLRFRADLRAEPERQR